MVTGPYGVTLSRGSFKRLRSSELIRDSRGIWRDGDGERLAQPKSTLNLLFAELHDFFFRTSRGDFDYHVPKSKLIGMAVGKSTAKIKEHPFAFLGAIALAIAAAPDIERKINNRSRARSPSRSRIRSRSVEYPYAEPYVGFQSPSQDRYFIR